MLGCISLSGGAHNIKQNMSRNLKMVQNQYRMDSGSVRSFLKKVPFEVGIE